MDRVVGRRPLPGQVLQTQIASTTTEFSVTTAIPFDATIPQNTEGDEILTVTITPFYANSKIRVMVSSSGGNNSAGQNSIAIFKDSDVNAVAASIVHIVAAGTAESAFNRTFILDAGDKAERTYSLRMGPASGTLEINRGATTANLFGAGTLQTIMTVEEIAQ